MMDEENLYCDECGEHFDNIFEMIDHELGDGDEFDPAVILPNGFKLLVGSLLRFIFNNTEEPLQIKEITQSVYFALYVAEFDNKNLDEFIEEMVVGSEMLKFDSSLKALLDESKPDETNESGA